MDRILGDVPRQQRTQRAAIATIQRRGRWPAGEASRTAERFLPASRSRLTFRPDTRAPLAHVIVAWSA
jgi:hypothetical protein